jgi:hypothetical protein
MKPSLLPAGLALLTPLLLAACAENPLGDPVWSDWDHGAKPVAALDSTGQGASEPTGAIAATPNYSHSSVETQPLNAPAPLDSAALPPPPAAEMAPAPAADPYQTHYIGAPKQIVPVHANASEKLGHVSTGPVRTAPLDVTGTGSERNGKNDE